MVPLTKQMNKSQFSMMQREAKLEIKQISASFRMSGIKKVIKCKTSFSYPKRIVILALYFMSVLCKLSCHPYKTHKTEARQSLAMQRI